MADDSAGDRSTDDSASSSSTSGPPSTVQLFDYYQCIAAIRGQAVPDDMSSVTARCSVVRGIRCHYDFAISPAVAELCCNLHIPEVIRARNARLIMSNVIPDGLEDPQAQPFCIWNPDLALEDTYRELARRYPAMRYQVGRACAVAGYVSLYKELELLPDVSIAEEAREGNTDGGHKIYQLIMASPGKYAVIDDRTRSINTENLKAPVYLNGDTAVHWTLEYRSLPPAGADEDISPLERDIEEDRGIDDEYNCPPEWRDKDLKFEESKWLYSPLPQDLPTMKKDLLMQMAAYDGNLDRYARLMDPTKMTEVEIFCVVHGIYHNTMFARWWADQLETNAQRVNSPCMKEAKIISYIRTAINARRIMVNDISGFSDDDPNLPFLIWWPVKPLPSVLSALARKCPSMKRQIAIASIYCDYQWTYIGLHVRPDSEIWEAAQKSPNPFYLADVEKRAAEQSVFLTSGVCQWTDTTHSVITNMEPRRNFAVHAPLHAGLMEDPEPFFGLYSGYQPNPGAVEAYVWQKLHTLRKIEASGGWWEGDTDDMDKNDS